MLVILDSSSLYLSHTPCILSLSWLPFFLLLLVYTPFAASNIYCYALPGLPMYDLRNPNVLNAFDQEVPISIAVDCLHIVSSLPSSLHVDASTQAAREHLTLNYGHLASHRFDMPAPFIHNTCAIRIIFMIDPAPRQPSRPTTRQETAYYFWNAIKSSVQSIVHTCLNEPRVNYGGQDITFGTDLGFTQAPLRSAVIYIKVVPVGEPEDA